MTATTTAVSGESAPSNVATATVAVTAAPPAVPTGMTATPNDDAGISLSWTAPNPSDYYWVWYRDETVGGAFAKYPEPDTRNTFLAVYLCVGHEYSFFVQAISPAGGTSAVPSTASATVTLAAPSNLKATAGDGLVRLTWRQPLPGQWYWIYVNGNRLPDALPEDFCSPLAISSTAPRTRSTSPPPHRATEASQRRPTP